MLPESLDGLSVAVVAGILTSIVMFAIYMVMKATGKEVSEEVKQKAVVACTVIAGLLYGLWVVLTPEQQMSLNTFYLTWRPVLVAVMSAFGFGGFFWGANQLTFRAKKAIEPKRKRMVELPTEERKLKV